MIGIHLTSNFDGSTVIVWFPFPRTLEQGDQLVERLQREVKTPYADPGKACLGGFWHQGPGADPSHKEGTHEAILPIPPFA